MVNEASKWFQFWIRRSSFFFLEPRSALYMDFCKGFELRVKNWKMFREVWKNFYLGAFGSACCVRIRWNGSKRHKLKHWKSWGGSRSRLHFDLWDLPFFFWRGLSRFFSKKNRDNFSSFEILKKFCKKCRVILRCCSFYFSIFDERYSKVFVKLFIESRKHKKYVKVGVVRSSFFFLERSK